MKRLAFPLTCCLFVLLILAGCSSQPQGNLTVYAAASLTEPFKEIGAAFTAQNPKAKVDFNFAGSQTLVQQIASGAPADLFASADAKQMNAAVEKGRVAANSQQILVHNRLEVVVAKSAQSNIQSLADLAKPGLRLVLAAKEVPVGNYALQFLDKASQQPDYGAQYSENVLANVQSYEENVKAVLTKVSLGEADAGIVYRSDAPKDTDQYVLLDIPEALNVQVDYFIAILNDTKQTELAKDFQKFVLSSAGQDILKKYGFIPAGE